MRQPPINNLDASMSKIFGGPKTLKFEFRIDAFNVLNHTQFTGFNGTANFTSLSNPAITKLGVARGSRVGAWRDDPALPA